MTESNLFYWYDGNKILLHPSSSKRAILFTKEIDNITKVKYIESLASSKATSGLDLGNGIMLFNINNRQFRFMDNLPKTTAVKELMVFENEDKDGFMVLTDEIIVKLKEDMPDSYTYDFFENYRGKIREKVEFSKGLFKINVSEENGNNTLDFANQINNHRNVLYAHPNFIRLFKPLFSPNDPLFDQQWALQNKGQNGGIPGNDINALLAWNITTGSEKITIAIIDEGVDYLHEDLNVNNKLMTGYDSFTTTNNSNPENDDAHGTACAGIAAGAANNNTGISGVAPGCKIMGVRIAKQIDGYCVTDEIKIADGIEQAYKLGADVLSNSWGGGSPSMHITQAIRNAKTNGRNGKGCIICFAAGNNNGKVLYPGSLPEVITVSACNEYGERKGKYSSDGETWWGSNFGPEVDVCAPGVHIITTDISGNRGYSNNNNYYDKFNGTSAATPHVAGVAALVLSVNPNLIAKEVEDILRNATNDLGMPGYNIYTGFGRIDAFKAVTLAKLLNCPKCK